MGNCIIKESSMQWGGEDWTTSDGENKSKDFTTEKTSLLGVASLPKAAGTEVKIRISRKQLEDLLKDPDVQGSSAQEVLARFKEAGDRFEAHGRAWTPALQSIPE